MASWGANSSSRSSLMDVQGQLESQRPSPCVTPVRISQISRFSDSPGCRADEDIFGVCPLDWDEECVIWDRKVVRDSKGGDLVTRKASELSCVEFSPCLEESIGELRQSLNIQLGSVRQSELSVLAVSQKTSSNGGDGFRQQRGLASSGNLIPSVVPHIPFPRKASALVWIRRDLFISRRFAAADCYPARDSERIGRCKEFKFSRDWWSWRIGGKEICEEILKMVQAGRGSGRQGGGRGSGGPNSGGGGGKPTDGEATFCFLD
jgi:hypothetical protein